MDTTKFNEFRESCKVKGGVLLTKKPIIPEAQEIRENSRSRSSKLRIIQKL